MAERWRITIPMYQRTFKNLHMKVEQLVRWIHFLLTLRGGTAATLKFSHSEWQPKSSYTNALHKSDNLSNRTRPITPWRLTLNSFQFFPYILGKKIEPGCRLCEPLQSSLAYSWIPQHTRQNWLELHLKRETCSNLQSARYIMKDNFLIWRKVRMYTERGTNNWELSRNSLLMFATILSKKSIARTSPLK